MREKIGIVSAGWGDADQILAELAPRFRPRIMALARRMNLGGAAAEDAAQETFKRVLESLRAGKVDGPEVLPAYVFAVARNVCLNLLRGRGREGRALGAMALESARAEASQGPSVLDRLVSEERRAELRAALERLEDSDRELLRLIYGEGLESEEIARRLELKPGTLRVRKHRAIARLGALLGQQAPGNAGEGSAI